MNEYSITQKPLIQIIGISCRTSNAPGAAIQDIPQLWGRFYAEGIAAKIPNKASNDIIALYCDYEGDFTKPYTLVIGCPVTSRNAIPEGMLAKEIPAKTYARYVAKGEMPLSIFQTWQTIWQDRSLKRAYTGDYELYGEKYLSGTPKEVEIFIAI